ncbi:hypothetical protein [Desulfomarina profundi]|uniref:hypothetical protein n=1 Tax=Desulfomarina profundi TaxID=2772557 RepID=UPI001E3E0645|nr:hypothetical protein [Desulfomarina profundi]
MMTVKALGASKALMEVTTFKVFIHYMRDYRTVKPILLLKKLVIALFEIKEVAIQEFPQGGFLRLSSFIDTGNVAAFHAMPLWLVEELWEQQVLTFFLCHGYSCRSAARKYREKSYLLG